MRCSLHSLRGDFRGGFGAITTTDDVLAEWAGRLKTTWWRWGRADTNGDEQEDPATERCSTSTSIVTSTWRTI
jgi:hypothetical protein